MFDFLQDAEHFFVASPVLCKLPAPALYLPGLSISHLHEPAWYCGWMFLSQSQPAQSTTFYNRAILRLVLPQVRWHLHQSLTRPIQPDERFPLMPCHDPIFFASFSFDLPKTKYYEIKYNNFFQK